MVIPYMPMLVPPVKWTGYVLNFSHAIDKFSIQRDIFIQFNLLNLKVSLHKNE